LIDKTFRDRAVAWIRPIVSLGLVALVVDHLDVDKLHLAMSSIDQWLAAAAVGVLAAAPLIAVPRWGAILARLGWPRPAALLTRALYVGAFFSQVLPSSVGGDVWRMWHCMRSGVPTAASAYSVLIERFAGVCATVIFFAASFAGLLRRVDEPSLRYALWVLLVACVAAALSPIILGASAPLISRVRLLSPLAGLAQALATVGGSRRVVAIMGITALGGQIVMFLGGFVLARSIGAPLSFGQCIATMPPALLIALFPLSFGGWGLREGAFVMILSFYGIPAEQALILSVSFGVALLLSTLPGLAIWWCQPLRSSAADDAASAQLPLR
jgi:uncharacterized membrane protein YbhN (UPF0104 family)